MQFTSQSDQKLRPLDLVREKTDKLKSSLDNFRLMFKGYNKMHSSMLPKGVSMLMANNNQDEEDEGPFKRGGIRGGIRGSHRRVSCPEDDVMTEIGLMNELRDQEEEAYSSLPPISLRFDAEGNERKNTDNKKKESRLRSNSLFEFLGTKKDTNKGNFCLCRISSMPITHRFDLLFKQPTQNPPSIDIRCQRVSMRRPQTSLPSQRRSSSFQKRINVNLNGFPREPSLLPQREPFCHQYY